MIGLAPICWAIWKTRNNNCFEQKLISSPMEIVCLASSFLKYWAGLHKEELQVGLLERVKTLLACAHRALAHQAAATPRLLLAPCTLSVEEEEEE